MSRSEINATAASLLGFLHAGSMTGWDLDRAVRETIGNFWHVTRSQVYRELRTLDELGYVQMGDTGPRERRPYTLTSAGRLAFAQWIARGPGQPIIRMPLLLTVFFGEHLPPGRLAEIVAAERQAHVKALEAFRVLYEGCREADPFVAEVVRFGIGYHEHVLAWLEGLPASGGKAKKRGPSTRPAATPSRSREGSASISFGEDPHAPGGEGSSRPA